MQKTKMNNNIMPIDKYVNEIHDRLEGYSKNSELNRVQCELLHQMNINKYAYNFTWLGRPIIQIPQDTVTLQELIWEIKPDLIIETGIAHGGSLIFSASMLALLELFGQIQDPVVVGIDIDIRSHNRSAIEQHPAAKWIHLIEGSSTSLNVIAEVESIVMLKNRVMVFLDSDHTHDHVLAELRAYAPLVTKGSYCVVADTGIEDIEPSAIAPDRVWCKGNSPKSALTEYLKENKHFVVDQFHHEKAWVTSAPGGYIKRI